MTTFGYRTRTKIGFWNVKTLLDNREEGPNNARFLQLEKEFLRYNLDILGLSEVRWLSAGQVDSPSKSTFFIYSGKPVGSSRYSGVGLMMTPKARQSLITWKPINDRILTARFQSKLRKITIIQCYAPTLEASDAEKDEFYSQLSAVFRSSPSGDITIVMGDLNAKVGQDNTMLKHVMGNHGIGERNDNGERFVDFCNANQLVIGGTLFEHRISHKISWLSTDRQCTANLIDHFAISKRFKNCLLDVRNRRGADVGLARDHHLMLAYLRLRIASVHGNRQNFLRTPRYNTDRLRDPTVRQRYKDRLAAEAEVISITAPENADQHWSNVKKAFATAAIESVGIRQRSQSTWLSVDTWSKIEERNAIRSQLAAAPVGERDIIESQYRRKRKEVQRSVRRDKRRRINALAEQAEEAASRCDSGTVYKITKELIGNNNSRKQHLVKDVDGTLLVTDEDQLRRWKEHFASVLNHLDDSGGVPAPNPIELPAETSSRIRTYPPSLAEITSAIKSLKNNKAVGLDGIPAELYQADPQTSAKLLHPLISKAWENESFPVEWKKGMIVKLPKKGNLTDCGNWRGICVLPAVAKIMAKIILERIKEHLDSTLDKEQAGFRAGSSCIDHINTLRIIIEQCVEFRSPLHLLFIDFEKAFDSLNRDFIWSALRRRGVPEKIIAIIKATYEGASCQVLHNGKVSEDFDIHSGVRQGCLLSPLLFLVVIGDVLHAALDEQARGIRWTMFSFLQHLDYADDICLLSHNIMDLHHMVSNMECEANKVGLRINTGKTKILNISESSSQVVVAGQQVEAVDNFLYLGSVVSKDGGGTDEDVNCRIGKAKAAFGMLSKVWRSNVYSTNTKLRLFRSNVESVLLYGCSTWKVTASVTKKLQTFENRCLRNILRIFWPNTISNQELLRRTGQSPIDIVIRRRKWQWIGHTLRRSADSIARHAMEWDPLIQDGRRPGGQRKSWRRTVEKESQKLGKSWGELKYIARNRTRWRVAVVDALCPSEGSRI